MTTLNESQIDFCIGDNRYRTGKRCDRCGVEEFGAVIRNQLPEGPRGWKTYLEGLMQRDLCPGCQRKD